MASMRCVKACSRSDGLAPASFVAPGSILLITELSLRSSHRKAYRQSSSLARSDRGVLNVLARLLIQSRSNAHHSFEVAREVALIGESRVGRHLRDRPTLKQKSFS